MNAEAEKHQAGERMPEVTIAIVFLDAMPHFRDAVQSVLQQTFTHFELLLIDDGSADGSLEFARSIRDPRVRVISDGLNLKLNFRLNQSLDLARGRYYFRMDADDLMFPDRVEKQLGVLRNRPNNTVVGAAAVCIGERGEILGIRRARRNVRSAFQARHAFIHPTVCASLEWFRATRYSNSFVFHRSQDAELWVRTFRTSRFVNLEEPLLFYRERPSINVENYIGSALGLCIVAARQRDLGRFRRVAWLSVELAKCWTVLVAAVFSSTDRLVRARNGRLSAAEAAQFDAVLRKMSGANS